MAYELHINSVSIIQSFLFGTNVLLKVSVLRLTSRALKMVHLIAYALTITVETTIGVTTIDMYPVLRRKMSYKSHNAITVRSSFNGKLFHPL